MAEARRVVLLARPGDACDRLRAALREAGGELVLEADPCALAPDALAAAAPQVVLVALDPVVEDVLDQFDSVLADPAVAVIYDEADLAARREGWDAARWVRHLGAKLHQHDDVLPPGRDPDEVVHPVPGRPATPEERHADADFANYASEAESVVAAVPAEPQLAVAALGGLELTDDIDAMSFSEDAALPEINVEAPAAGNTEQAPDEGRFRHDLAELERRIASLELVDAPAAARGPEQPRGAVLVLAGIGGPDAVRQLLAGIPEGFSRPVLVCQRLDGGRYDRLVQQMARATNLPVQLAEAGTVAAAGQVYIVAPELGVAETDAGLKFTADAGLLAALPPSDSAVLLLSGSDPADVDTALAHAARGALVAGQSPEGCYDAAAPGALIARGGSAGSPADLVKQLLKRWPA
jgi:chemosensory pili system protein ChpB (putative protein-glutamate methylesterase)